MGLRASLARTVTAIYIMTGDNRSNSAEEKQINALTKTIFEVRE